MDKPLARLTGKPEDTNYNVSVDVVKTRLTTKNTNNPTLLWST